MPRPEIFWSEVARLGRPGAAVLLVDLQRPESPERARAIVETYSGDEPEILKRDFLHSLCAAFTLTEVTGQLVATGLGSLNAEMISDRHWAVWGRLAR